MSANRTILMHFVWPWAFLTAARRSTPRFLRILTTSEPVSELAGLLEEKRALQCPGICW